MEACARIAAKLQDDEAERELLRNELAAADGQLCAERAASLAARADARAQRELHDVAARERLAAQAERADTGERLRAAERARDQLKQRVDWLERARAADEVRSARLEALEASYAQMSRFAREARLAARKADGTTRQIRAQQHELLAHVDRLEAAAAGTAAAAQRANARAASARSAAVGAAERGKASLCSALFFRTRSEQAQATIEMLRAQLADTRTARERLEADLERARAREAQHVRLAAAAHTSNARLNETVESMLAERAAREATEATLALELRALEAEQVVSTRRAASWRATRAQLQDDQAQVRMHATSAVEEANALQLSVALQRDEALKALAARTEEVATLEVQNEALQHGAKKQYELVKELGAMLHAAQQQLVVGGGAPAPHEAAGYDGAGAGGASSRAPTHVPLQRASHARAACAAAATMAPGARAAAPQQLSLIHI
mgnify:CR=1 FL=1